MLEAKTAVPDRALQGTNHTTTVTVLRDGAPADATGNVTVDVTREDGTSLVAGGTAVHPSGQTGVYQHTLSPAQTAAQLDVLKYTWTGNFGAAGEKIVTYVEVVAGFLFSIGLARALKPLNDATKYPATDLATWRTVAEQALEDVCGVAFVPRYARDVLDGDGTRELIIRPRPLSVISATIGGTSLSAPELADLQLYRDGRIYRPGGWSRGRRNVVIKYVHGYEVPPARVGRATLRLAKRFLIDSPIDDRTTSMTNDQTGTTQFYVTAGVRDAIFDIPEANAVVEEYGVRAFVA